MMHEVLDLTLDCSRITRMLALRRAGFAVGGTWSLEWGEGKKSDEANVVKVRIGKRGEEERQSRGCQVPPLR